MVSPASLQATPLIEQQHQFLYSSAGLNNAALPNELNFFQYAKGQDVPGAGNAAGVPATIFHTNMETPGALAAPKIFTATGIRLFMPNTKFTATANTPALSDPSAGAAAQQSSILEDLQLLAYSSTLRFVVGPKAYVNHPIWFAPSNTGTGGLAAVSSDDGTAATNGQQDVSAPHLSGHYYGMRTYPIVIASQQSFNATIACNWPGNPSLNEDRLVFIFLDGVLGREVS